MRGYGYETNGNHQEVEDEYGDEYYDQDEYDEEGSGAGDEYFEEEEPTEGQKEILELRERLKEQIRRKAKAAASCTAGRSSSLQIPQARDKFGSFFGPSKPVISRRVIEERKSLKELHSTVAREPRPSGVHKDIPSSSKVQSKVNGHQHKQKIVNQVKKKAEALKDNRDYSFLLSDDADLSSSPKEKPAARSSLTQRADREVMRTTVKSKAPTSQPARVSNGYGSKNKMSTQRHAEGRVDTMRKEAFLNRERVVSRDNERMHERVVSRGNERMHGSAINGSNQASTSKTTIQKLTSRGSIANKQASTDLNDAALRKSSVAPKHHFSEVDRSKSLQSQKMQSAGQRLQHSSHGQRPHQSMQHRPQQSLQSRRPQQMTQDQKPQQSLQSQRTQQSLQNKRQQQSSHIQKSQSSQAHRPQSLSNRSQELRGQRPLSSQGQYLEQRRVQANDRVKQAERHIRPPSKSMPSRPVSSNGIRDDHAKRKQVVKRRFDDDDDEDDPLAMIRNMFGYAGRDEDVSDMEADFATIEMEEKRSARIARQEDEEQLRLIEEEERREQERKRRKMARGR
ncbi:SPT2 chromatin protein [Zea mays]|uniref:SPT2 chromatin protein n=1 Tax=Zea mays TaxID=4577 RepID=A0A1D6E3L1_MAIZE|nr:SPT2 chromatin protein [Zea mays]